MWHYTRTKLCGHRPPRKQHCAQTRSRARTHDPTTDAHSSHSTRERAHSAKPRKQHTRTAKLRLGELYYRGGRGGGGGGCSACVYLCSNGGDRVRVCIRVVFRRTAWQTDSHRGQSDGGPTRTEREPRNRRAKPSMTMCAHNPIRRRRRHPVTRECVYLSLRLVWRSPHPLNHRRKGTTSHTQ